MLKPDNEIERLEALFRFKILDTENDEAYDAITRLAASIMKTPIAFISFVDENRTWIKSKFGKSGTQSPRELSFCTHAIMDPSSTLIVTDATRDDRFSNNPYVVGDPKIRFYCGSPIVTANNEAVGAICGIDSVVRKHPSKSQITALEDLSKIIINQLETREFIVDIHNQLNKLKFFPILSVNTNEIENIYKNLNDKCDTALERIRLKKKTIQ